MQCHKQKFSFLGFLSFSSSVLVDNKHNNISVNFREAFLPLGSIGIFHTHKKILNPPIIFLVFILHSTVSYKLLGKMYS